MSEFTVQSEPVIPQSVTPLPSPPSQNVVSHLTAPNVTKPQNKGDPQLYMNNERNTFQAIITACVILLLGIYIPLVIDNKSVKWMGILLCLCSLSIVFVALYTYKRNITMFEKNEQNYIDWDIASFLIYSVGGILMITSSIITYEMYWNIAGNNTQSSPSARNNTPIQDDLSSVGGRSVGSVKSSRSQD